jgi:hypothetical protein
MTSHHKSRRFSRHQHVRLSGEDLQLFEDAPVRLKIGEGSGEVKSTHVCPNVNLKIGEIDFQANLVILTSSGIDVILGMNWLSKHDGIILCAKKSVLLITPQGGRIEFSATSPKKKEK